MIHVNIASYTVSGPSTARPLPDWLARRRKRSAKYDTENLNNFELLQEFEFEEGPNSLNQGTQKQMEYTHTV